MCGVPLEVTIPSVTSCLRPVTACSVCVGVEAIVYARVSTETQGADGISLDNQQARAQAWAVANGCRIAAVFVEVQSGARAENRPELQKALAAVARARGVLVVYSLSRLARSVRDAIDIAERLDRSGANLASITEKIDTSSAVGRLFFRLMSSLAEFERDQLSERTTSAMAHLRHLGRRISSRVPFGYDLAPDRRTLLPNAGEQTTLALMQHLRGTGLSYAAIAAELTSRAVATKCGRTVWAPTAVFGILSRARKLDALPVAS